MRERKEMDEEESWIALTNGLVSLSTFDVENTQ